MRRVIAEIPIYECGTPCRLEVIDEAANEPAFGIIFCHGHEGFSLPVDSEEMLFNVLAKRRARRIAEKVVAMFTRAKR